MSAASVGQIGLDLVVNQGQFQRQMNSITSMAKKAGAVIAGAFAVKKIFDFGKEAINLGSDLTEVQNVVDVTFSQMSAQVDQFAKDAAASFGLSETMAKKYVGTFGAMSKAFGFSEAEAYKMSTALTGLAGDVASFYNMSQDEAYTKLKSVFTGETETLKDLGVVMTQNALDAYAMANGYGRTTAAMSEAEKVALRFAFVQDQLSLANGDFARTSGGWANQVRILQLQMQSFMAAVGQGLINIFTPAIKVINLLMGKLIALANLFKAFTEAITGKSGGGVSSGMEQTGAAAESAASGMTDAGSAASGAAKKTKKAAKEIKGSLAGFDEINVLQKEPESSDAGAGVGGIGGGIAAVDTGIDFGAGSTVSPDVNTAASKIQKLLSGVKSWYDKNFAPLFKGIGKELKPQIAEFQKTLNGIWSDIGTLGAPLKAWFLNDFTPFLQQCVITMGEVIVGLFDSFNMVFSDIWNIVIFPSFQKFLTVVLPVLTQFCTEVVATFGTLFAEVKGIFDLIWSTAVAPALSLIMKIWSEAWATIQQAWNTWGHPIFDAIRTAIQSTGAVLQQIWTTVLQPVWETFMQTVDWLWTNHLQPLMANFLDFVGTFINGALRIYNEFILPVVSWFVETLGPPITNIVQGIVTLIGTVVGAVADYVNGLITVFKGLVEFITGVFTGDWGSAWEGVVTVFKGVFQAVTGILKGIVNSVIDLLNMMIRAVIKGINYVIGKLNSLSFDVPDWIPGVGGKSIGFNIPEIGSYQIPKLATGAVIPPNSEFLAMLGDQRSGRNLEAPEGLIRQIMREEMAGLGGGDIHITIEASANEGQLIRYLTYKIKQEDNRKGKVLIRGVTV